MVQTIMRSNRCTDPVISFREPTRVGLDLNLCYHGLLGILALGVLCHVTVVHKILNSKFCGILTQLGKLVGIDVDYCLMRFPTYDWRFYTTDVAL